jgi:hypothetical protein
VNIDHRVGPFQLPETPPLQPPEPQNLESPDSNSPVQPPVNKDKQDPPLFSDANHMDQGPIPIHLRALSDVEEMLIARAHVHRQIARVRGHQYQYTGHVVCFAQNTPKVWHQLPLLPRELDIVILKPAAAEIDHHLHRRFRQRFTVRRSAVDAWLRYLKIHHPAYADVEIDDTKLQSLPVNDSILDLLSLVADTSLAPTTPPASQIPASQIPAEDDTEFDDDILDAVVSNLSINVTEAELLQHEVECQQNIELPTMDTVPIDERADLLILSSAFPTLFPAGKANFALPRSRSIKLPDYAKHLLKYKDGRFGRHPRFRYYLFNCIMRGQALSSARYICQRSDERSLTLDELKDMIENNLECTFLRKLVRQAGSLRGTRPYWNQRRNELGAYARSIRVGSLFFTLSAAGQQWYDLQSHMPRFGEYKTGSEDERY